MEEAFALSHWILSCRNERGGRAAHDVGTISLTCKPQRSAYWSSPSGLQVHGILHHLCTSFLSCPIFLKLLCAPSNGLPLIWYHCHHPQLQEQVHIHILFRYASKVFDKSPNHKRVVDRPVAEKDKDRAKLRVPANLLHKCGDF